MLWLHDLECPYLFLTLVIQCTHKALQHVVLDLWRMIYYPIKSTSPPNSQRLRERKLSVNCCSGIFLWWALRSFFLLSNSTLGNIESPVSILSLSLIKHDHTAIRSLAPLRWPAKSPAATGRGFMHGHKGAHHDWSSFSANSTKHSYPPRSVKVCFIRMCRKIRRALE